MRQIADTCAEKYPPEARKQRRYRPDVWWIFMRRNNERRKNNSPRTLIGLEIRQVLEM
jgi:hypothetical protein